MSKLQFEGPIQGWIVNFLSAHYWKVQRSMPREDVMQEAYVVFLRCRRKYPEVEEKHFMALFKTAWTNHFTDLANEDTARRVEVSDSFTRVGEDEQAPMEFMGSTDNDGMLAVMIRQAPSEVQSVLMLLLNAPSELLDLAQRSWREKGHYKAGGPAHLSQLLGLPAGVNPLQLVEDYFRR